MSTRKQKDFYIELLRYYNEFSRFGRFLSFNRQVSSITNCNYNRLMVLVSLAIDLIEDSCPEDIRSMFEKYGK